MIIPSLNKAVFGSTDLSLGIFDLSQMNSLCRPSRYTETHSSLGNSLIKRKKVSDFPIELNYICGMLAVIFANQNLCLFSMNEKGELLQLLLVPSDQETATPLRFFRGGLVLARIMADSRNELRLLIEQPRQKNRQIEVDVTSIMLAKGYRGSLKDCHTATCIYKSSGLVTVTSVAKDSSHQVSYTWTTIK